MDEPTNDAAGTTPGAVDAAAYDKLKKEKDEVYNQLLRTTADFQNSMRRAISETDAAVDRARGDVYRQIIPVIDHFDTALTANVTSDDGKQLFEGVRIVRDELLKVLKQSGVERVEPKKGDAFDPHSHEAMMRQPAEGVPTNHVTMTFSPGYTFKGRTLRPAKVAVAP
jgi:molecular chaperone GrpE